MVRIHAVELGHVPLFAVEELNDLHARHGFLDVGIDSRDLHADGAKRLAHLESEDDRGDGKEGDDGKGPERELGRQKEEHERETEHLDDVGHERDETLGEHLRDVLDVIGGSRHQAADRNHIEKTHVQSIHVTEDVPPQIAHRILTGRRHQDLMRVRQQSQK